MYKHYGTLLSARLPGQQKEVVQQALLKQQQTVAVQRRCLHTPLSLSPPLSLSLCDLSLPLSLSLMQSIESLTDHQERAPTLGTVTFKVLNVLTPSVGGSAWPHARDLPSCPEGAVHWPRQGHLAAARGLEADEQRAATSH